MGDRPVRKIRQSEMEWATNYALERIQSGQRVALERATDWKKKERRAASKCRACFYSSSRIGGAAMTSQPCGICEKDQMYSSTCTDVVCIDCARLHQICKECGADVELRPRRKLGFFTEAEEKKEG